MFFHGNSDYMNVPKCYVVCTLTVSFFSKTARPALRPTQPPIQRVTGVKVYFVLL